MGGLGVALAAAALTADVTGIGEESVFGVTQILVFGTGVAFVAISCAVPRWVSASAATSILMVLVSVYGTLVLGELWFEVTAPVRQNPDLGLRGMFVPDPEIGFRLAPNWSGIFDDGIERARYETNSIGHRDAEPKAGKFQRSILLIGDSFAFGYGLDQSETIDKSIEDISDHHIDVYNAGVQGYGPPAILESLVRCDWFRGTDVVYLFFNNDLRDDNLLPDMGMTVFAGHLVPKFKEDGSPYSDTEYREKIAEIANPPGRPLADRIRGVLTLSQLVARLVPREHTANELLDVQGPGDYRTENVEKAAQLTFEMRSVSARRGAAFSVAVMPSRGETRARSYAPLVKRYIQRLRAADVPVIELLGAVRESDYVSPPDIHVTPEGGRRVALAIVRALESASES